MDEPREGAANPPEPIGPYRILGKLGEGGFGEVWIGEQTEPVKRQVAVKVLKAGMDTNAVLARFEAERQALSLMNHRNIARILDAGATDSGHPYFVMDLIRGSSITRYCDEQRLSTRARVELFVFVCLAVQHAHQKGVIHRDLKPSNLLVAIEDGVPTPKVIDFGIAKAVDEPLTDRTLLTIQGQLIGTPAYMSPEQAAGALFVDTTTDIYSLGAVLYELLTGSTPFESKTLEDAGFEGMPRILREVEPPTPSTRVSRLGATSADVAARRGTETRALRDELKGELDWITMRAMEKDPGRRYASASDLAADLRRYLANEPVVAAPPGAAYRARKFVRRHRAGVAVAAAVMLTLLVFAVTMTIQANRIARERDRANRERESAERVASFLSDMLGSVQPEVLGNSLWVDLRRRVTESRREAGATESEIAEAGEALDAMMRGVNPTDAALRLLDEEILARAGATVDAELADDPLIAARLHRTFAHTYRELGLLDRAEPHVDAAIALCRRQFGPDHEETLESLNERSVLLQRQGRLDEAERNGREALDRCLAALGPDAAPTLAARTNRAVLLSLQGKFEESIDARRFAYTEHLRVLGPDHLETLTALLNLALTLHEAGQLDAAEPLAREAVDDCRRVLGPDHPTTLTALGNLGMIYSEQERLEEAEAVQREALEASRRVLGSDHPSTLIGVVNLGAVLDREGRLDEAADLYRQGYDGFRRVLGEDHPKTLAALNNLGFVRKLQGRYDEAEEALRAVLATSRRTLGPEHPQSIVTLGNLGDVLVREGRAVEAEPLLRRAVADGERFLPAGHWLTGVFRTHLGNALAALGRDAEAEEALLASHAILCEGLGADHERTRRAAAALADLYARQGRADREAQWRGAAKPAAPVD
jgi:eukaryotic-like serine/threonine-protein kinase